MWARVHPTRMDPPHCLPRGRYGEPGPQAPLASLRASYVAGRGFRPATSTLICQGLRCSARPDRIVKAADSYLRGLDQSIYADALLAFEDLPHSTGEGVRFRGVARDLYLGPRFWW